MANNETTTAQTTAQNEERIMSYEVTAKVLSVLKAEDGRMRVITDKGFVTIDYKTEKEEETTAFSLNPFNLLQQVCEYIPILKMANTMAMGEQLNPQITALKAFGIVELRFFLLRRIF